MPPAVVELKAGARDEVLDRPGDEHLAGQRLRGDRSSHLDGNALNVPVREQHLAGVQARANLGAERSQLAGDRAGAADRAGRAVEDRKQPVAVPDGSAAKAGELRADDVSVTVDQRLAGRLVSRRSGEVGEQERHQDAIELCLLAGGAVEARHEVLDLVEQGILVTLPGQVIVSRQLDRPRARDVLAHETGGVALRLLGAVDEQGGHPDRGQDVADVDLPVHQV